MAFIQAYGSAAGIDVRGVVRPSPYQTNFTSEISAAVEAGAKIVIHIFSAIGGFYFIRQWGLEKPTFACIGINVESMAQEFWWETGGLCEYETILAPVGTGTNLNPYAKPLSTAAFWDEYKARYDHYPIYTAWGAYDAIIALNETSYDPATGEGWMVHWQAGDIDKLIEHIETLGVSDGFTSKRIMGPGGYYYRSGILGLFKFTGPNGKYHDVYCTIYSFLPVHDGVVRPLVVQWQAGRMEVIWPRAQDYSRKWMFPSWMYSLETDFAGGPLIGPGYPTPDRIVGVAEMTIIGDPSVWFKKPPLTLLEADMSPQDHFINIYDIARVAKDWLKTGIPY